MGAASLAPGITFKAQTTLDVREYTNGLPAEMEVRVRLGLGLGLGLGFA